MVLSRLQLPLPGACLLILAACLTARATEPAGPSPSIAILPQPLQLATRPGVFHVTPATPIAAPEEFKAEAQFLSRLLAQLPPPAAEGGDAMRAHAGDRPGIRFSVATPADAALGNEGYELDVQPDRVGIRANTAAGAFHAVQTLRQLLPAAGAAVKSVDLPGVHIVDRPRFRWRGLMLDVSRHFFPADFVKSHLDQMAALKFNVFHWHLSDDEGWRVEIPGAERLTEIGAWREPGPSPQTLPSSPRSPAATVGGFYTAAEIRDVVAYAAARHITIVPEVDVPGHNFAATAAYPELTCTGKPERVLCAGNEAVFAHLEKVFGTLAALFPGEYIHFGGDEVNPTLWQHCPKCQERMRRENLHTAEELQGYFMRRVAGMLARHGKKVIGWDEIVDGGLPPGAAVMSWRSDVGGVEATKRGHLAVMTPMWPCYLDFGQGDRAVEPKCIGLGKFVHLREAFELELVPADADANAVIGGQGNLWTELVATPSHVEYMTWPRGAALAEAFWSPAGPRNWDDFVRRLEAQMARWDVDGVNYARSAYLPLARLQATAEGERVVLTTEIAGTDLHYTFAATDPDEQAPRYEGPLVAPATPDWTLRVAAFRNGKRCGPLLVVPRAELVKRREQLQAEYDYQREDRERLARKFDAINSAAAPSAPPASRPPPRYGLPPNPSSQ